MLNREGFFVFLQAAYQSFLSLVQSVPYTPKKKFMTLSCGKLQVVFFCFFFGHLVDKTIVLQTPLQEESCSKDVAELEENVLFI